MTGEQLREMFHAAIKQAGGLPFHVRGTGARKADVGWFDLTALHAGAIWLLEFKSKHEKLSPAQVRHQMAAQATALQHPGAIRYYVVDEANAAVVAGYMGLTALVPRLPVCDAVVGSAEENAGHVPDTASDERHAPATPLDTRRAECRRWMDTQRWDTNYQFAVLAQFPNTDSLVRYCRQEGMP